MMDINPEYLESSLVMWIRTFTGAALADLTELVDGHLLNKIMTEIDPTFFGMSFVHLSVHGDIGLRVHNLEQLMKSMKSFYQEKLQQVIVMNPPNIFTIANDPESDESVQELGKILLLILGCAVQCERKEFFIEKITSMNEILQQELVLHIKEITEKCDKVFTFQPSEIVALSHEELFSYCEDMYDQMVKLIYQRDCNAEESHRLLLDKFYPTEEVNGNIRRVVSPPLSPRNSEILLAGKNQIRELTEELEEKHLVIQELREELELSKSSTQRLTQENKNLMEKARLLNAYRDQVDVLHIQAERTNKLESDIAKYKERLLEMEGMKKRTEELEEQNEILYSTKVMLEKQVASLSSKSERLGESEGELAKLKTIIKALTEEKRILETKHENAVDENTRLLFEAQNSLSEVSNLNSALDMIKDKDVAGTSLATECNQISSTQLLRLEHENNRLKVLIGELAQHKAAGVPQVVVKENKVDNGTYERTIDSGHVTSEEHKVESVDGLTSTNRALENKGNELTAAQEQELTNIVLEPLAMKEQENRELHERIQQLMNQKKRTDQLIHRKDEDVVELERRLEEVISERQKSEENVRKKTREVNELANSLSELKEDNVRTVETAEKKAKDIIELKERVEVILSEKEKLVGNCSAKDKKLINLENRLQRIQEANKELAETLESKLEKISNLENRVNQLISSGKEEERRYTETIREKNRRLKEFERKIGDLIEVENELERLDFQIKQKDRKSEGFLKTIEKKDQEIVELENRLEDAKSNNNKLLYNAELKEKKVESLEQRLLKAESKAEKHETNEDEASRKRLETRDDKILELESRLEDALNTSKKLQHTLKVKDETIVTLETRLEETQVVELERNKLVKSLDEKKKRIAELESSLDDLSSALETENKESEKIKNAMKEKEEKVFSLTERLQGLMEELALLENRIAEANSQNKQLVHALKNKDVRIANLEESVLDLEQLTNKNQKLKQIAQQKEEKIRTMDDKMDEYEEATRKCKRLMQKITDKEDHIKTLNERLTELETQKLNSEILKQAIAQKDERIKILEVNLEDVQLKCSNMENELTKVQSNYEEKVKRSLEDVDTHKVRRQESVRRREEQIKSLEQSRSKLETVLQTQEGHIQSLHDRLEGSVTVRNKLDSSIIEKESVINELQTKVREVELVLSRAKSSCRDKDEKVEELQKRIEECAGQNKILGVKLKKKEEILLENERELLQMENREKELDNSLENNFKEPQKSPRSSTSSVNDSKIKTLKQKLWDAETRMEEADQSMGKLQHQIKRKDTQIQDLEKQLEESTDALKENERLKKNISHKEERIRILQLSLEQNQNEINSLESRLESSTSEVYKLRKSDDEKRKRINSFKMNLEDSNGMHQALSKKEERIRNLEERNSELQRETSYLSERLVVLESELKNLRSKKGSAETVIVSASTKDSLITSNNHKDIDILNGKIEHFMEKTNENLNLQKKSEAIKYASLRDEKESLTRELETLRCDHDQLINYLNELKDSYTELDLSSAKSLHRCEMLTQMNNTLEEENRMLMEQMNKLLSQNQELLTESLVSRDQFMEEERSFSDRLYELRRQKEKLEEKIEQANRSLAENTPKKKSNLFKKVLQKAGLKKKKDESPNSKTAVQLIKYDHSPNKSTDGFSDVSADNMPGFPDVYPLSPERASDSSNFSESVNSDISPERDISPLFRRRPRINRAHRSRVARSEYSSPALVNALAAHGRSRSLDAKEFIDEVVKVQESRPKEESHIHVSSNLIPVVHNDTTPSSVNGSRQITRTQSFNLGESDALVDARKKRVESKPSVNNTPELATTKDRASASPKVTGQLTGTNNRKFSDASRKSSEACSSHSRSSSMCDADTSSDTSKTTVRHIGSTPSSSGIASAMSTEQKLAKTGFISSGIDDNEKGNIGKDELRLSFGCGHSTGNDKQTRVCRHKTPSPPPRMSVPDRPGSEPPSPYPAIKNAERFEDKPPTKRSSSFAERSQSPVIARNHLQRQNSDRVLTSSMEVERRNLVHAKATPTNTAHDQLRRLSSTDQRPSSAGSHTEQATAQSIGIVCFKEVPRIQSAVLESSSQPEKKKHRTDVEIKKSEHSNVNENVSKESPSNSGANESQTPRVLRRAPKLENLSFEAAAATSSSKKERVAEKSSLWFEYGQV